MFIEAVFTAIYRTGGQCGRYRQALLRQKLLELSSQLPSRSLHSQVLAHHWITGHYSGLVG